MVRNFTKYLLAVALCWTAGIATASQIVGYARVVDGDTLRIGDTRVRLHGIDAVENDQTCLTEQNVEWACGAWVTAQTALRYDGKYLRCDVLDTDRYGRSVARCWNAGVDINAELVADGYAAAYRKYSKDYVAQELAALEAKRGLWAMRFQSPDKHRARDKDPAQTACKIKGNISPQGRIFHVPGQAFYNRTRINTAKGERWFCTASEATQAGWRAARS